MRSATTTILAALLFAATVATGCTDDVLSTNPAVQPLVGDWNAFSIIIISAADPEVRTDLTTEADFSLNVQPSGQYTAILLNQGRADTEIGLLDVEGSEVVFFQDFPAPDTSRAAFLFRGDTLHLEGETQFPFSQPGLGTDAFLVLDMVRD